MSGKASKRRRRTAALAAASIAGTVAIGGGGVMLLGAGDGATAASSSPSSDVDVPTTEIAREDLVETADEDGTLGYDDERPIVPRLGGTVTWLKPEGATVRRDHALYKVDGKPVVLLQGDVPAYRVLSASTSTRGTDVNQLERNLRELGYADDSMEVDRDWDSGTTEAVQRWQRAHGLDDTGSIELGRVEFAPDRSRRMGAIAVDIGAQLSPEGGQGTEFLSTTSTRRIVTVKLETTKTALAVLGSKVNVEMPSGKVVRGTVASVGKVAEQAESDDGQPSEEPPTIELEIALGAKGDDLDQAPVTVSFERSRRKNVLTVPVTALQARPGGKYVVEVVSGGRRRAVEVEPGLYAGGSVEISGAGLEPGMRVTNASVE